MHFFCSCAFTVSFVGCLAQYRGTVNITSLQYKPALGRRESEEFKNLAQSIGQAIENVYTDFPGTQTVQVLQFRLVQA